MLPQPNADHLLPLRTHVSEIGEVFVCNIGHSDNEIRVDKLEAFPGVEKIIKYKVDKVFPDGRYVMTGRRIVW